MLIIFISLFLMTIIIIFLIFGYSQKETFSLNSYNLYGSYDDISSNNDNGFNTNNCPPCVCQQCPPCVCPKDIDVVNKYLGNNIKRLDVNTTFDYSNANSDYKMVGYLNKNGANVNDKYGMLPVYGKEYRGGFFKYYVQFVLDNQIFKKSIFKSPSDKSRTYTRELYDGDVIDVDSPINSKYTFKEETNKDFY